MTPTVIALLCALSLSLGVGGTLGVQTALHRDPPEVAPVVVAVADVVAEAEREDVTDAQARLAVAQAPAVNLAVEAAVKPGASPRTMALAAYLGCLAAAQGKGEGSAAFGCQARGAALDLALTAGE